MVYLSSLRNRFKWASLGLVLAMAVPAFAQPTPPWAHEQSDLLPDPKVEWGVLENGLRFVVLPWEEPPERVSLRLVVEAGSLHETESQRGLAHFIEHMAFNGTENYSAGEMVEYFQRLGMDFGADTNAHTWWRETVYKLELPNNNPELMQDSFLLLRDYADRMLFLEEEIETERGVILSEKRDRKTPQTATSDDRLKFTFPEALFPDRIPIGIESVIRYADRDEFVRFYEDWYTVDRMAIIAVGAIDKESLLPYLEEHFGSMEAPEERRPEPALGRLPSRGVESRFYDDAQLPFTQVHLFSMKPHQPSADTLEGRREELILNLATEILNRRFEVIMRVEEDAPFMGASAYAYDWMDFVSYAGMYAATRPEDWEDALDRITVELTRALEFGFTQSELNEVRARTRSQLEDSVRQASTRRSRSIADAINRAIIDGEVFMHPQQVRDQLLPLMDALTVDDLNRAFSEAWDGEDRLIYVAGDLSKRGREVYEAALEKEVLAPDERGELEFAYTDFGEPGEVVEREFIEDLELTQAKLDNHVRVNVMSTPYDAGTIHVHLRFGSGLLEVDPEQASLIVAASSMFIEGGLGAHDREELQQLMAGHTVSTGFSVDEEAFVLSGRTSPDDFRLQMQLLTAYLSDPGYRSEAERVARRQYDSLYNQLRVNPQAVMQNQVPRFLAGGDPRFGYPDRESLEAVDLAAVAAFLESPLKSGFVELSIVGDVENHDQVLSVVAETLGALPERMEWPEEHLEARKIEFPRGAGRQVFHFYGDLPQGMVAVHWPTTDALEIETARNLSVLGSILSDRLRRKIREEIGEAYSPYAFNRGYRTFPGYGYMRGFVGVDPAQADFIADLVIELGADLAENGFSEDELLRTIEPQKTSIRQQRRDNRYWLNSVVAGSQLRPEQLDWSRTILPFWDNIDADAVAELARKYLQEEDAVKVLVLPAERD